MRTLLLGVLLNRTGRTTRSSSSRAKQESVPICTPTHRMPFFYRPVLCSSVTTRLLRWRAPLPTVAIVPISSACRSGNSVRCPPTLTTGPPFLGNHRVASPARRTVAKFWVNQQRQQYSGAQSSGARFLMGRGVRPTVRQQLVFLLLLLLRVRVPQRRMYRLTRKLRNAGVRRKCSHRRGESAWWGARRWRPRGGESSTVCKPPCVTCTCVRLTNCYLFVRYWSHPILGSAERILAAARMHAHY